MCDILLSSCETSRGCRHQTENQVLQPCTENAEMLRPLLHPGSVGRRPPIQPPHLPRGMAARLLRGGEGQQHGSSALALARVCAQATHRAAFPKPRTKGGPLLWDRTPQFSVEGGLGACWEHRGGAAGNRRDAGGSVHECEKWSNEAARRKPRKCVRDLGEARIS